MRKWKKLSQQLAVLENQLTRVEEQIFCIDAGLSFPLKGLTPFQQVETWENEKAQLRMGLADRISRLEKKVADHTKRTDERFINRWDEFCLLGDRVAALEASQLPEKEEKVDDNDRRERILGPMLNWIEKRADTMIAAKKYPTLKLSRGAIALAEILAKHIAESERENP